MTNPGEWPTDYFTSRRRFIELANACGARTDCRPVDAVGPGGEALSVDVAALTSADDEHRIILVGGVHGVEGFVGAGIQLQALRTLAGRGVPERTGIVMIHAANPWGFAHLRRVDANNVDVNRNFIDVPATVTASPTRYAALDPLINPRQAPSARGEMTYWLGAAREIVRHRGIGNLVGPIAEGQYRFPRGVFYGGAEVGESCRLLQELVLDGATAAGRVTLLDLHSGLGPSGTATLIANTNLVAPERRASWLDAHYSRRVIMDDASGNAYDAQGTFARWCRRALGDKRFLYLCVEIGTVNPVTLFSALKRENQAHHWSDRGSRSDARAKRALLDVFAPRSRRWREAVVAEGLQVLERTFDLPVDYPGERPRLRSMASGPGMAPRKAR